MVFQSLPALRCNCTSLAALLGVTCPVMRPDRLAVTVVFTHCDSRALAAFQKPGASSVNW